MIHTMAIRPTAAFSLVDYGCGTLADYPAVRELHNCEYIGYDISDAMIEAARSWPCRLVIENPKAPALAKRERDVSVLFVDISGYGQSHPLHGCLIPE